MRRNCSIQQHVGDETNGSQADHELGAQRGTRQIESLWDQIEEGYAYQGACAESEYQVKSILLVQREQPTQQCRYESRYANRYRHGTRICYLARRFDRSQNAGYNIPQS